MKERNAFYRCLMIDPVALAAACTISLLFANASHQFFNIAKRNLSGCTSQTSVCVLASENDAPEECTDLFDRERIRHTNPQKNSSLLPVTFEIRPDYGVRLNGYVYGPQLFAWLPSIPIAHRKLII